MGVGPWRYKQLGKFKIEICLSVFAGQLRPIRGPEDRYRNRVPGCFEEKPAGVL